MSLHFLSYNLCSRKLAIFMLYLSLTAIAGVFYWMHFTKKPFNSITFYKVAIITYLL